MRLVIIIFITSILICYKTAASLRRNTRRLRHDPDDPHAQPETFSNYQSSFNSATSNDDDFPEGYNPYRFIVEITDDDDGDANNNNRDFTILSPMAMDQGIQQQPLFTTPPQEHFSIVEFSNPDEAAAFAHDCKNRNVTVERDPPVFLQSLLIPDEVLNVNRSRHLAQTTPWGINKVFRRPDGSASLPPASHLPPTITHQMCIIDSGYEISHPDLINTATNADPSQSSSYRTDNCGHGSHVAGTVLATDNNEGVLGVFPGAASLIVKVFSGSSCGWTYQSSLVAAVNHCANRMGDRGGIISMSLGGSFSSNAERRTFERLYEEENILSIAAAGNGGHNGYSYPASYASVMSVGATDSSDNIASFSQHNDEVDIVGPGVNVRSTVGSGYSTYSGTSMATPHVSGVAFLLWNRNPGCTNEEIREALEESAVDLGAGGRDDYYGKGLVNYWRAVEYLQGKPCGNAGPPTSAMPTASPVTNPPTVSFAPTPTCQMFELELQTDNYGSETTWNLKDSDGSILLADGPYANNGLHRANSCLPPGRYAFTIYDSYADGICCNYGRGYYEIKLEGRTLRRNDEFTDRKEVTNVIVADEPPQPTTREPTVPPTPAPPCGLFELELKTDNYGSETSWTVVKGNTNVLSGGPYESNTENNISDCLPGGSYTFTIYDSYADGICCSHGRGYYEIKLDGRTLKRNERFKGRNEATPFLISDRGAQPTPSPTRSPTIRPTFPPTKRPTPVPTVASPTSCRTFVVRVTTDAYGYETHWKLTDASSSVRLSGGPYSLPHSVYTDSDCLDQGSYVFTIYDTFSDGICCSYGRGSYEITLNDDLIKRGDRFGSSEATSFHVNGDATVRDTTGRPTVTPSFKPTTLPPTTVEPTLDDNEESDCHLFNLELQTDNYGAETTWTLYRRNGFNFHTREAISSGGPYAIDDTYQESRCLSAGSYAFVMRDGYGDGMCCELGEGWYKIRLNGELIHEGREFRSQEVTQFFVYDDTSLIVGRGEGDESSSDESASSSTGHGCLSFEIDIGADHLGDDSVWELRQNGRNGDIVCSGEGPSEPDTAFFYSNCIDPGNYALVVRGSHEDGECCFLGGGFLGLLLDGMEFHRLGNFGGEVVYEFDTVEVEDRIRQRRRQMREDIAKIVQ